MHKYRWAWPLLISVPLLAWVIYPIALLLLESVTLQILPFRARAMGWNPDAQPLGAPLRRLLYEAASREAISGTIKISILSALTSCAWGLGLALLWWRREFPLRRFFAALGYAPLLMPPLVGTLAFFRLIGDGGLIWASGQPPIKGFWLVLIMHTYSFGVFTYAYVAAALDGADQSREEAARSLGAGPFRSFWTAVLPVIWLPLLASALLTLMASAASFSAPFILDNSSRYLTVEIVREAGDTGMQRALTAVLAILSLAVLPLFLIATGQGKVTPEAAFGAKGAARRMLRQSSAGGMVARLCLSVVAMVLLLTPPLLVIIAAVFPSLINAPELPAFGIFSTLTSSDLASLARSSAYAAIAAAIVIFFASVITLTLRRATIWTALPIEIPVMLAIAIPGSAIAIALKSAVHAGSWLSFGVPLGNTAAILIIAYAIRDLPLAVRPARAAIAAVGTDVEHAASSLGATPLTVKLRILLPLIFPSLLAAFLVCFINGAGEFVASVLLFSPSTMPVSVRINELYRLDPAPAYALSLCLMLMSAVAIAAAAWLQRRLAR
ncbi:MAG TPA: ABC transporter permease subunit [Planctomycetota bacterium]|nr:ABC transporter permease subunit [Planctomycetota bacterium]